jgi:hypothetical protein
LSTPSQNPTRRNWFDGTVNLPTIIAVVTTLASIAYYGVTQIKDLQSRVSLIEQVNTSQEDHFRRIEASQTEMRSEVISQLRDLNNKIDQLMFNGAVNGGFVRGQQNEPYPNRARR